jgi:hypothetical protein
MKKKIAVMLACVMCMTSVPVFADNIGVVVNGESVEFADAQPVIIDSRTLVPLRGVFEKLGYTIYWKANTKTAVIADRKNGTLRITAGSSVIYNGEDEITSEVPAQIINGRMYLPLRAVGEAAGLKVAWDAENKMVYIGESDIEPEEETSEESVIEKLVSCDILYAFAAGCKNGSFDKSKVEIYLEDNNMRADKEYAQRLATIIKNGCDETELDEFMSEMVNMTDTYRVEISKKTKNVSDAFTDKLNAALTEFDVEGSDFDNAVAELELFNDKADAVIAKLKAIDTNSKAERECVEMIVEYVSVMQAYAKTGLDVSF